MLLLLLYIPYTGGEDLNCFNSSCVLSSVVQEWITLPRKKYKVSFYLSSRGHKVKNTPTPHGGGGGDDEYDWEGKNSQICGHKMVISVVEYRGRER